ncbi:glycosyltransferase [Mangrovivirga cuniculi]|uniref:Spore protein YkvP/CgeB glycosyl transferase-like domain-containing protein n=1 Tax=Mangrovivirga cuniculi TaxID=2715131 RepID=A0A4D7JN87_9BACT|nr:hypothetical protein DCC35_05145 [Mangrovivirga cuniculi]
MDSILLILDAAASLKGQNIRFDLTGVNSEQTKIIKYITDNDIRNVNLINFEDEKELNLLINYSSVCLGIFGNSKKSNLGIPKDLFKYAACRKPIISKNSLALKEVFTPGRDILAVENSAERIASMIRELKNDPEMGQMVGHMAKKKIERDHHFRHSAAMLLKAMKKLKLR